MRDLGFGFIPTFIPVRFRINGTEHTMAGFAVAKAERDDTTELFAGLCRDAKGGMVMLIWRERFIGLAGRFPNGQAWVQHIGQQERLVPCIKLGAHQLLREYIDARLTKLDPDLDDWRRIEATDGRR